MARWLYRHDGQTSGPVSSEELQHLARQGQVLPDDTVQQEGRNTWVPAKSVRGLFDAAPTPAKPTPPPLPQQATVPPPVQPAAAGGFLTAFLRLPRPLVFALFGAVGGLVGAVLLGELLWQLVSPAGHQKRTEIQAAVPEAVRIYPGSKNRFGVKIARHNFKGAVQLRGANLPAGVQLGPLEIAADADEAEVEVTTADTLAPGQHAFQLVLEGPDGKAVTPAQPTCTLNVERKPPALAVVASAEVVCEQGRRVRFVVRITRANFADPIAVTCTGLPAGVTVGPLTIPAEANEIVAELTAERATAQGVHAVTVHATSNPFGKSLTATAPVQLSILKPSVDVLFVLDLTSSMGFAIDGVKAGVQKFASDLEGQQLDARIGLIAFRDIVDDSERPFPLKFGGDTFTKDYTAFSTAVGKLQPAGGGDGPESSLQALALAGAQPFRTRAGRVIVLITDAPPKNHPDEKPRTAAETVTALKGKQIDQLHLLVPPVFNDAYKPLRSGFEGSSLDLQKAAGGTGFNDLLATLSKDISRIATETSPKSAGEASPPPALPESRPTTLPPGEVPTLKAVQSTQDFAARDLTWLLVALLLWTMVVAACISLFLVAGQQVQTRRRWVSLPVALWAVLGGAIAGLVGGMVGQFVFQATLGDSLWEAIARLLGWTCLGGLLGVLMAFAVPNLRLTHGLAGGLLGGLLGAIAFVGVSSLLGSLPGRWLGAAILGFCLGLMVALADLVFRRYWLEVAVSKHEVRTVTLGTTPVLLGSDETAATVFVSGVPPVAYRYWVEGDKVQCEDVTGKRTFEVAPGDTVPLGKTQVTVRNATTAAPTGFVLAIAGGPPVQLREGLPLTAEDLPGLSPQRYGGMVALVSRQPNQHGFLLRNRSAQTWTVRDPDQREHTVAPGQSLPLALGVRVTFGQTEAVVQRATTG